MLNRYLKFVIVLNLIYSELIFFETVLRFESRYLTNKTLSEISQKYNLKFDGIIFNDYYIFSSAKNHHSKLKRSISETSSIIGELNRKLKNNPNISWFDIQSDLVRTKRDLDKLPTHHFPFKTNRAKYKNIIDNDLISSYYDLYDYSYCKKKRDFHLNDPEWSNQWYMNSGCEQGFALNVTGAWRMGYTGKGVVVSIIDDGIERENIELVDNFDWKASYDINDNDNDPQPRFV